MSQTKKWGDEDFWGLGYEWDPQWVLTDKQKEQVQTIVDASQKKMRDLIEKAREDGGRPDADLVAVNLAAQIKSYNQSVRNANDALNVVLEADSLAALVSVIFRSQWRGRVRGLPAICALDR